MKKITSALISVFCKDGLEPIVRTLHEHGVMLYSTGGTLTFIENLNIPVIGVDVVTGYPAILGGRVKTLHPKVFGGILARQDNEEDVAEMEQYGIPVIDLVIVDLYPFEEEVRKGSSHEEIIEKIDIGGISLIRAAGKNYKETLVVSSRTQYERILALLQMNKCASSLTDRHYFAGQAFLVATYYDAQITKYFEPEQYAIEVFEKESSFCYGENRSQSPAVLWKRYGEDKNPLGFMSVIQHAGNEPSYNNGTDFDSAMQLVTHIVAGYQVNFSVTPFVAVGVKHGNPCGAAANHTKEGVIKDMLTGNLKSIHGGSIIVNFEIDETLATLLRTYKMPEGKKRMLDMVIAPSYAEGAMEILSKRKKCRVMTLPALETLTKHSLDTAIRFRYMRGGVASQPNYTYVLDLSDPQMEKNGKDMSIEAKTDLVLAWAIGCTSNSNTITIVKDGKLLGNGVCQQDRVEAGELALKRARDGFELLDLSQLNVLGSVAYSDSFFPFPDGVEVLAKAGIKAIFATSGSENDAMVREALDSYDTIFWQLPDAVARGFAKH